MTYVVRNFHSRTDKTAAKFLDENRGYNGFAIHPYEKAHHFTTLEEAKDQLKYSAGRHVVEVSYGLRWYHLGKPEISITAYFTTGGGGSDRKGATRFATKADALAARTPFATEGWGGPDDRAGYRVVRFMKVVAR